MKKLISLLLVLCMACMLIPAMAEEDVTGDWYGSMMGMGITMTLNADGTFSIAANGQVMASGTWKLEDGKLVAEANDTVQTFEIRDGILYEPETETTLTRNPEDAPAAMQFADARTDAAAEEFYGEWAPVAMQMAGMVFDVSAYSEQSGGDVIPNVTISEDAIKFTEDGMFGALFSLFSLVPSYADGIITAASDLAGSDIQVTVELLQDGMLKISVVTDSPMVFFYQPAEAAAEEPAA